MAFPGGRRTSDILKLLRKTGVLQKVMEPNLTDSSGLTCWFDLDWYIEFNSKESMLNPVMAVSAGDHPRDQSIGFLEMVLNLTRWE